MAVMTYREALNMALREEMQRDPRVFVMGEEVGLYDGAYKVTQGLLKEFGPRARRRHADLRVRLHRRRHRRGHGRAAPGGGDDDVQLLAARPRPDRQLGRQDALHVGRPVPRPHRDPRPGRRRPHQLAAQHSQSMESYFYHVPGLKVVRPSTPTDAKGLLKSAIRDDNPVIFIEAETLYTIKGEVPEDPTSPSRSGRPSCGARARTSPSSPTWA